MSSSKASSGPPAVRMIFEYEGDAVRLVSQQSVNVAVTGFDLAGEHRPGHYVEVRGAANETLSRVRLPEAMTASAEVFPEEPGAPIVRVTLPEAKGAFTVVVPAPPEADHVSLIRVPGAAPRATEEPPAGTAVERPWTGERPQAGETGAGPAVIEIASFPLDRDDGRSRS